MTFQNRVDPWGRLHAVSVRGAYMGNRGILHNEQQQIVTQWPNNPKSWITCETKFKGRQRKVFSPGSYTELFFLDEATAFSAGHRPCAECRRARYNEFKNFWLQANALESVFVKEIDKKLHEERTPLDAVKIKYTCTFEELPAGAFIELEGVAYLFWNGKLKKWSHHGYLDSVSVPAAKQVVTLLTPPSIVKLMKIGLVPQVHDSATQ